MIACSMLGAAVVSCAATPDTVQTRQDAVLLNADRADIREAIRIFVRKDAGRFVRAEPDSLADSPDMVVHRRAPDYESQSRSLPPANLNYRLMSDGIDCWLIRHESGLDSPVAVELPLPKSAQCVLYSEK